MTWKDEQTYIEIYPSNDFNFDECLFFLNRSNQEVLHQIIDGCLYKLLKIEEDLLLLKIKACKQGVRVDFPIHQPSISVRKKVASYIWDWFDFNTDLDPFYQMANTDPVLSKVAPNYKGLRIIGIPDLFEALSWAIIGQQINLTFAYTLKKRLVEQFGESLTDEGHPFWLFPSYDRISTLRIDDLTSLQFSTRKAEYIIGIAKQMTSGELSKEELIDIGDYDQTKERLTKIRGVGAWTADYVMMKSLHHLNAFPISDVGLHNALKSVLNLDQKPSISEIKEFAARWQGWEAYATFYLWRSLYV
ncbi:DNA-3-methyladenine glycosylase [Bacillus carboniphilus]|uniref:DNA-3-methyladenine glycosylase II n=1 Tax=Bacillus carboniphilus TaxID=86663 RepID=A0ABY9JVD6_9BACI|nr:DNA-3-methyladenine glycosylase [Bacillus carboniphilus]WLR43374.1 DNA-3-methyladenine glycosylase [Bacillus carboniphilus]